MAQAVTSSKLLNVFPRTIILTNSKSRTKQIFNTIKNALKEKEELWKRVKIAKYVSKSKKQKKISDWNDEMNSHDIVIMLNSKCLKLLVHGDISLKQFKLLIHDEANQAHESHSSVLLTTQYIHNDIISQSFNELPLIISFYDADAILSKNKEAQRKFYSLTNMLNSRHILINKDLIRAALDNCFIDITNTRHNAKKPFEIEEAIKVYNSFVIKVPYLIEQQRDILNT